MEDEIHRSDQRIDDLPEHNRVKSSISNKQKQGELKVSILAYRVCSCTNF